MVVRYRRTESFGHTIRDDEQWDLAAAAQAGRTFVPRDKQHAAVLPRTAVQNLGDKAFQEIVACRHRAIVHIMALIRDNQRIVRGGWIEMRQVGDIGAALRRTADVGKADRRVVLADIGARAVFAALSKNIRKAVRRYVFRENLPGFALRFELIGEILAIQVVHAIVRGALRRAAKQRNIVWLGGVGDPGIVRRQAVLRDQAVEIGRV